MTSATATTACAYSDNHGLTWNSASHPAMDSNEEIVGVKWFDPISEFVAITSQCRVSFSSDGGQSWSDWAAMVFTPPSFRDRESIEPLRNRGLQPLGGYLVCPMYNNTVVQEAETDLFFTDDGITWERSGSVGLDLIGRQSVDGNAQRVHLVTTSPGTWYEPDRYQLLMFDKFGSGPEDAIM
jgi:hypothetical protein